MSVYRHKDSPFYHYDFQLRGHRFHGSTGAKGKREAEGVERTEKAKAKKHLEQASRAKVSLRIDDVADRYWLEVGQHHAGRDNTERDLARLIEYFGKDRLLTEIDDDDVAELVAWRRVHTRRGAARAPLIAPATVNRSTTEVLKKLFKAAKVRPEPDWKRHWLKEPQERVRELQPDEAEALDAAARDDYRPIMDFADESGLRLNECLLKWSEVNWQGGQIIKVGKGDRKVVVSITSRIREILWPLRGHHGEWVFTYICKRTKEGRIRCARYPITYNGLKTEWKRHRKRSGIKDFRFHDKRHDFATKLLRNSRNLKIVQKALNHADIKTTMRYAHVLDQDVAEAVESMQNERTESRNKSRSVSKGLSQTTEKKG